MERNRDSLSALQWPSLRVWKNFTLDGHPHSYVFARGTVTALRVGNRSSQTPSENYPRPENRAAERVGLIATGTHKFPYFRYKITLLG
ncbi:hypothetical protein TNCV_4639481 [Trichonephila clavipes]|nr:hypothetical protein TNCV_4639481 [Trichonephila clavipes]